ncbi:MAG: glycosyltransferase family 61 protein [Alphaproteobacteria bacterium]|nr:glycosyltransferase family 61 protein [Alphaproteobacteria bacterium]
MYAPQVYSDKSYSRWFRRRVASQRILPESLDVVSNAVMVNQGRFGYGVYDAAGRLVQNSRQIRGRDNQIVHAHMDFPADTPYIDADVMYLGNVYPQFGHFMLEHMNRAWGLLRPECAGRKVVLINDKHINPVPEYMYKFIELMGVPRSDIIILNETTRFRSVAVPSQSFEIDQWANAVFSSAFEHIAENVKDGSKYEKIYMSRDALGERRTYGEAAVQRIFEKNGFKIIRPETLSLDKQIALMKNCKVLAGCAGTALHMAVFMPRFGTVIQIKRNRVDKDSGPTQELIHRLKDIHGIFISGSIESEKTDHSTVAPQVIGVTKYMRQFFDDNGFSYDASDLIPDSGELAEYAAARRAYRARFGSVRFNKFKHMMIKLSACTIPGRERRGRYRAYMNKLLKVS